MAINKGNADAMNNYGRILSDADKNDDEAIKYFKMAADLGNVTAISNYTCCLELGKGTNYSLFLQFFNMH